jgi:hypothetical protein
MHTLRLRRAARRRYEHLTHAGRAREADEKTTTTTAARDAARLHVRRVALAVVVVAAAAAVVVVAEAAVVAVVPVVVGVVVEVRVIAARVGLEAAYGDGNDQQPDRAA